MGRPDQPPKYKTGKTNVMRGILTPIVYMAFHIPVGVRVPGIVLLVARDFDLLEAPLRQDGVRGAEIASEC